MRLLNGSELAGFIKQRHASQVQNLKQTYGVIPKLAILQCIDDDVINTYVRLKKHYGKDIDVEVEHYMVKQSEISNLVQELNKQNDLHGIIVQLPLTDPSETDAITDLVLPIKDVDALGTGAIHDPATPMAIMWLLAGYNIEMKNKNILLIGKGKLVGAPLEKILKNAGHNVNIINREVNDISVYTIQADIIITATGSPAIIYPEMIKHGAVVIDAGVASEDGKTVGDVAPEVYQREDLTITPAKGGVGPLTVCALFENLIRATQQAIALESDQLQS